MALFNLGGGFSGFQAGRQQAQRYDLPNFQRFFPTYQPQYQQQQIQQPANINRGQVLPASTIQPTQPSGGGGGQPQPQPSGGGGQPTDLFQQQPVFQLPDYDAMIAPALQGLESAITPLQSQYQADIGGTQTRGVARTAQAKAEIGTQVTGLERAKGTQAQLGESAAEEARRQFSEVQQGLQARYGRTTGTGQFAAQIAGTQTLRNIANIRQGVSQAILGIDDKIQQVQEIGRIAVQDIEDQTQTQIKQAKADLERGLATIRQQKGELQARKAELAGQAIQLYQNTVQQVNAQNTAFKQQLFVQQQNAENQLKLALQKAQTVARNPQLAYQFLMDPIRGTISTGNRVTGQVTPAGAGKLPQYATSDNNLTSEDQDLLSLIPYLGS